MKAANENQIQVSVFRRQRRQYLRLKTQSIELGGNAFLPEKIDGRQKRRNDEIVTIPFFCFRQTGCRMLSDKQSSVPFHFTQKVDVQRQILIEQHIGPVTPNLSCQNIIKPSGPSAVNKPEQRTGQASHVTQRSHSLDALIQTETISRFSVEPRLFELNAILFSPLFLHEFVVRVNIPSFMAQFS